jgi:hypothetical protein
MNRLALRFVLFAIIFIVASVGIDLISISLWRMIARGILELSALLIFVRFFVRQYQKTAETNGARAALTGFRVQLAALQSDASQNQSIHPAERDR